MEKDKTMKRFQNEIGKVMNDGVAREVYIPLPVEGYPDLICTAKIEVPRAVTATWKNGQRVFISGKWSVEKQMIVWDD